MGGSSLPMEIWKVAIILVGLRLTIVRARPGSIEDYIEGFVIGAVDEPEHKEINPKVDCLLPSQRGHCRALIIRWRYDATTKDCREFKFGGCGGNANNFFTKKQCWKACKVHCREFKFGGCGGNANNFFTKKQCWKACKGI